MSKKKKEFPIKYMRKGLFRDAGDLEKEPNKKGKRRIRKPKTSVHMKTEKDKKKVK